MALTPSEISKRYRARNPEKVKAAKRAYREKNREAVRAKDRERSRAYYEKHREELNEYRRIWAKEAYAKNPEKFRSRRRAAARKGYGMVEATGEQRAGQCEICLRHTEALRCDHDHETGRIRGWLCNQCNLGLGQLGDTADAIRAALAYLEKPECD